MKIAFILPSLANKGPIVFTKYLIEGLKNKVDYIEVFYFKDIVELDLGVPTKQISFFEKIEFDKFDIIHTHNAIPDLYAYKSKILNKWITTTHDMYKVQLLLTHKRIKALLVAFIWSFALKKVNFMIVFSQTLQNYYETEVGQKEYHIITTGVSKKKIQEVSLTDKTRLLDMKNNHILIGASGLLTKRKGFNQLIKFLVNNQKFALSITGDGEEASNLLSYAKELGVEDRFILFGFKNNAIDFYKYYDIYALPSYAEGLPLSLLEAMSQSLPIVCSNLIIYEDYFTEKDVSFFELDNTESLEQAILKVDKNIKYYKNSSYKLYEDKFSLDVMGDKHIELYKKIING